MRFIRHDHIKYFVLKNYLFTMLKYITNAIYIYIKSLKSLRAYKKKKEYCEKKKILQNNDTNYNVM